MNLLLRLIRIAGNLLLLLLAVLIPFALHFLAVQRDLAVGRLAQETRALKELESYGAMFPGEGDLSRQLQRGLQSLNARQEEAETVYLRHLSGLFEDLRTGFPGMFEFAVFDARGGLVASLSDLPEHHVLLASVGPDLLALARNDPEPYLSHLASNSLVFGPFFWPRTRVEYGEGLVARSALGCRRAFLVSSRLIPGKPFVVAWITVTGDMTVVPTRLALMHLQPPAPGGHRIILDLGRPLEVSERALGRAGPFLREALFRLEGRNQQAISQSGFLWLQKELSRTKRLLICLPDMAAETWRTGIDSQLRRLVRMALALFFLFGLGLFSLPPFPFRTKVWSLFALAVGIPLCLYVFSVRMFLTEQRKVLEQRQIHRHEDLLDEFFRGQREELSRLELAARRQLGKPLPLDPAAASRQTTTAIRSFTRAFPSQTEFLWDQTGRCLTSRTDSFMELLTKAIPLMEMEMARKFAEVNRTDRPPPDAVREQALKASLESIGIDIEQVLGLLYSSPNQLTRAQVDLSLSYFLGFHLFDREGVMRFSALFSWGEQFLHRILARRVLDRFRKRIPGTHLANPDLPDPAPATMPTGFPFPPDELRTRCQAMTGGLVPRHQIEERDGRLWFLSARRGGFADRARGILVSSDEQITTAIAQALEQLSWMAVPLLLLGFLVGGFSSRYLTRPFRDLSTGLAAIRERDFAYRVPVTGPDELGRLSLTFNQMMENLEDLEVGKIIQETFFPSEPLRAHDWEVAGFCRPAAKVGGDYFDYFPLPDGRWLIIIGDVTGHGLPAALVVAMAKASFTHPSAGKQPEALLCRMNELLLRNLKHLCMTCFIAAFDPRTGALELANGGHHYPYIVTSDGLKEMTVKGPMLGFRSKRGYPSRSLQLLPGEWMFFFTDGLIEASVSPTELVGYERLKASLSGFLRPTAAGTLTAVRAWHDGLRGSRPREDDVTVVVLQPYRPAETSLPPAEDS